jgi:hypothetical protein
MTERVTHNRLTDTISLMWITRTNREPYTHHQLLGKASNGGLSKEAN